MVFLAMLCCAAGATAQTIESLEWVADPQGAGDAVVRIAFAANVRYLRQVPKSDEVTDRTQLSFQLVAADESVRNQVIEEGKRLAGRDGVPQIDLTYVPLATVPTKVLTLRFARPVQVSVRQGPGARWIDLAFQALAASGKSADNLPPMATIASERHFGLLLASRDAASNGLVRIPKALEDYAVFTRKSGATEDLLLGYFQTEADAERVRSEAIKSFPAARTIALELRPDSAALPLPSPPPPAPVDDAGAAASSADVNARAASLLADAQSALQAGHNKEAVDIFNTALMLPPNPSSEALQAQIGAAWEALNQPDKARLEYQLYLKLYPNGAEAPVIGARLAALSNGDAPPGAAATTPSNAREKKEPKSRYSATGSVSQYYYGGNTKTETLVNIASGIDQNTLNMTNQSVLVSSWDATGRYQGDDSETKLVMRGSHSDNLSDTSTATTATQGLISAAYLDYRDLESRLSVRVGRQSAIGGAMFGLFDGVSMATPFLGDYKLDAMAGVPANTLVSAPQQVLAGVMIEADNLAPHWGGNLSLVQQSTEGIVDRRAIGIDARYFGDTVSLFSQLDYDINFNALNAVTLQGSAPGPWDTTVTLMVDDRKAPSLQLSDALISSSYTSLSQLLAIKSLSEVQAMALTTAAEAKQAMVSISRALSPKWQGSIDLRYADVSALPAIGNFQATPATGAQYNISLQLTGSNLYSGRDINGFNISYLTSPTLSGGQIGYNNMTGIWGTQGSLEPSIRFYTQTDNTGVTLNRVSPGLRLSYKLSDRASLMGEGIYESSQTDGAGTHETSQAFYFYFGYRYDFQ